MSRRKLRELILQILFQVNVGRAEPLDVLEREIKRKELESGDEAFVYDRVVRTLDGAEELDRTLAAHARNWRVARIGKVERAVLHLALTEIMQNLPDSNPSMVINEAVRLAKKYAGPEAGKFVNGILGAWHREWAQAAAGPEAAPGDGGD